MRDDDPLLRALGELPGARLDAAVAARTLARAQAVLAAGARPRSRWLSADTLLPGLLCLTAVVHTAGMLGQVARVFGREPPAVARAEPARRKPSPLGAAARAKMEIAHARAAILAAGPAPGPRATALAAGPGRPRGR